MAVEQNPIETEPQPTVDEQPSLPLYIAGLIVTLAGILAVTLTVGDQNLTVTTSLLTVIGFIFSIGCRYLRVKLRIAEILLLSTAAYVIYSVASNQLDWHMLVGRSQLDIGIVFAWAMTAWSWALISDSLILISALLAMASIGLVASANPDSQVIDTAFIVFLFSSLFVMGQHLFLNKRDQAAPADRSRGMGQLWLTQVVVVLISAVLIFVTASAVVVPAEVAFNGATVTEALQGLATFQQAAKPNAEISGPNVSDDSDFDIGTGQGWGSSTEVVAYVLPSDHQPHYWKARTYDQYSGSGWTSSLDSDYQFITGREGDGGTLFEIAAPPAGATTLTSQFDVKGSTHEFFYTGELQNLTISRPAFQMQLCRDGHAELIDKSSLRATYTITSTAEPDPNSDEWASRLRKAGTTVSPAITQLYSTAVDNPVTTPDDVAYFQKTVKTVVDALPADKRDQFDEVQALTDYVSHRAIYNLNVSPLPAGTDHVRAFLQDTRTGYCDMFASSLAVLCRVAGFPSRVVTGFAPGNFDGTRYDLRVMDKHAWTEVYFAGVGWVPFDATSGAASVATNTTDQKKSSTVLTRLRSFLTGRGPVVPLLFGAILVILGYIMKVELVDGLIRRMRQRQPGLVSREEIGKQYELMVRSIGRLGLKRKPSETPFEFAARAVPYLSELEDKLKTPLDTETVETFTRHYTVIRYADDNRRSAEATSDPELAVFFRHVRVARIKRVLRRLRRQDPKAASPSEAPR